MSSTTAVSVTIPSEIIAWKFEKKLYPILHITFRPNDTTETIETSFNLNGLTFKGGLKTMFDIGGIIQQKPSCKDEHLFVVSSHETGIRLRKTTDSEIIDFVINTHKDEWDKAIIHCSNCVMWKEEWYKTHSNHLLESQMNIAMVELVKSNDNMVEFGDELKKMSDVVLETDIKLAMQLKMQSDIPEKLIENAQISAKMRYEEFILSLKNDIYHENGIEWPYPGKSQCPMSNKITLDLIQPDQFDNEATQKQVSELKTITERCAYQATRQGATEVTHSNLTKKVEHTKDLLKCVTNEYNCKKKQYVKKYFAYQSIKMKYDTSKERYVSTRDHYIITGKIIDDQELENIVTKNSTILANQTISSV